MCLNALVIPSWSSRVCDVVTGAKVNHPGDVKGDGTTPLHDVCAVACAKCEMKNPSTHVQRSLDVIEILLKHGANVNAKDKDVSLH